ncbi:hypothetical protein BCR34DRAFT_568627 [Clohesyomyces aquaticus]|uniref:Uncharacterized protein n=1 Tax=Clohesyomyces aquaticus TaxID=1231657 RepID=A0A1Y1ZG89_9PLEO|nr:hypothetical protein BCR34DRAFT_568627 [Clohesyomyces aquaticus]
MQLKPTPLGLIRQEKHLRSVRPSAAPVPRSGRRATAKHGLQVGLLDSATATTRPQKHSFKSANRVQVGVCLQMRVWPCIDLRRGVICPRRHHAAFDSRDRTSRQAVLHGHSPTMPHSFLLLHADDRRNQLLCATTDARCRSSSCLIERALELGNASSRHAPFGRLTDCRTFATTMRLCMYGRVSR